MLHFLITFQDNSTSKAPENVICKKCNCDAKAKVINCSNKSLTKMFTIDEWIGLNSTKADYEILRLDHNQFESIDSAFPVLKFSLKIVDFSHNKISKLPEKLFTELSYLEEIDFSYNELTTDKLIKEAFEGKFAADEFEPLRALRRLRLSYNLLHNLDPEIFEHTLHLQELYLDNNPFQVIHQNVLTAFSDIIHLQVLDMSRMELDALPVDIFHPLRKLRVLNLAENLFTTIPQALKYAPSVEELSLDENPLENIFANNSMPKMPNLRMLNMSSIGTLKVIGKGALPGLECLTELHLCNNHHLQSIDPQAFTFPEKDNAQREQWPPIKKLFLNNNNLTTLDNHLFIEWEQMSEIHIHDNPWLCDCELDWMVEILMPIISKKSPHLIGNIKCAAPLALINRKLVELSEHKSHMRCMPKNGSHPERDSALLVALLIGVLLGMPLAYASILIYKRGCFKRGPADFSRAFYTRADTRDDVHI